MTPDEFTKHVGAQTFEEAVDVILRTKAQDEDKIEDMFNQIKMLGQENESLKDKLRRANQTINELNERYIDDNI